jgi:hypothetical protein
MASLFSFMVSGVLAQARTWGVSETAPDAPRHFFPAKHLTLVSGRPVLALAPAVHCATIFARRAADRRLDCAFCIKQNPRAAIGLRGFF